MREAIDNLTVGERVAWYRRRRGLSQDALAGLVGRTSDWLQKAENNRIELDRLSMMRRLADALGVPLGCLVVDLKHIDDTSMNDASAVTALRAVLTDYRQISPLLRVNAVQPEPPDLVELERGLCTVFAAYQASRFGFVAGRVPLLLADAQLAAEEYDGVDGVRGHRLLALTYQVAASVATKLGDADLAWIAAERGLVAARCTGDHAVVGSLFRAVAFSLLSTGRFRPAMELIEAGGSYLARCAREADPGVLSQYGTLFLAGSMAASRAEKRETVRDYLREAEQAANRLRADCNHLWTSFGPTNVAIHRVSTAMELDDVQVALDVGTTLDTTALPTERRVRHAFELARAFNASNRQPEAMRIVFDAEHVAPEQVRHHYLSRQLVLSWVRNCRGRPPLELHRLARRMRVLY